MVCTKKLMDEQCAQNPAAVKEKKEILEICQAAADGDEDARRKLMDLLYARIHKTASYLAPSLEEAEDLAQTACIEVLLYAGTFRGESSLSFWADRVTLFTASKILTKKKRREQILDAVHQPGESVQGADARAERVIVRHRLAQHIKSIKYFQREVLLLRYIQGYTITEAAEICGVPLETARGRLKKGRAVLKKKVLGDPLLRDWVRELM